MTRTGLQAAKRASAKPCPAPEEIERVRRALVSARKRLLQRPIREILSSIAESIEHWFSPDSPYRSRAEAELCATSGFSPEMIRRGFPTLLAPLRGDAIGVLLDAELGGRDLLDRHAGPALILHIMPGNLPALAAVPIALSLAIRSAALVKTSRTDRCFPLLFIDSIRQHDGDLAESAASLYWTGGRLDLESHAFAAADLVVASGSDHTLADIARRVPGRFIGHGHRISFAAVAREALHEPGEVARLLADDVSLWDQQGCLSPQLVYVERGGRTSAEKFAALLAGELERLSDELPMRTLSLEEQAAVQRFRQEAEWREVRGEEVALLASPAGLRWTVIYDASPAFSPTPLNRCMWVKPVHALDELPALLSPVGRYLEAAGLAAGAQRRSALSRMLSSCGLHRICDVGEMQRPDLTWRPGGRPRVAEWIVRPP
jgi:hypothetical protein